MQIAHLVHRVSHFELIIFKSRGEKPKKRKGLLINPTPARYANTFCPVSILSAYCIARQNLYSVLDLYFLDRKSVV